MADYIYHADPIGDGQYHYTLVGELVRCGECEFYTMDEKWCRRLGLCGAFDGNDYCSFGERRADDE